MNNNITQEEKTAYDTFLNNLKDLLITSGEVTSSEIGDILLMPYSEYQRLGSFFKKLGFLGIALVLKKA